jgi:hypothetical protein
VTAVRAVAALSFTSACLHGSVMVSHFREYFLFGLFFAIVTPLQVAWAELIRRAPGERGLLAAGAIGNGAIAIVWLVSRTVGLPFGPGRLQAEAAGVKDVLATYSEGMIVGLVAVILLSPVTRPLPSWSLVVAWTVAGLGLVAALVGGGH